MRDDEAVADEATEVTTEEISENSTSTSDNGSRKRKKSSKRNKKGRKTKPQPVITEDPIGMIRARFAACGRCCYFLGSYTSTRGEEGLETAVQDGDSDWLTLTWDQKTRNLVHKAFGVRLDVDFYHYEGCCVACCRQFVYEAGEEDGAVFRVKL